MQKDTLTEVIKKVNELYILVRKKYLILDNKGQYYTNTYNPKDKKAIPLMDFHVKQHLQGKKTIGVFAGQYYTKFVCFDVDINNKQSAKMAVYKLIDTLQDIGISLDYIYTSYSGNKGYHVEIFFDNPVFNDAVKQFYLLVLNAAGLLNIDDGKIELRPTDTQGVKIPLGCNFKNKDWKTQECWFCDYEKGLELIKDYEYILSIKQMPKQDFYNILNKLNDSISDENDVANLEDTLTDYKPLQTYKQNIDKTATIESIEKLINEGLKIPGTRHNSLFTIARYYKYIGHDREQTESLLIDWLKKQDKNLYKTKWDDCLKDIAEIVKDVYTRGYTLTIRRDISVNEAEMQIILKTKGKNKKLLLYAMLIHSKRYANKNGVFFMSFKQMSELTGIKSRTTLIKTVNDLEKEGVIEIVQRNTFSGKENEKAVNKYRVKISVNEIGKGNKTFNVCDRNCTCCVNAAICHMFEDRVIQLNVSRREYEMIREYREYCVNNAV
jgi:biotin operon repressor